MNPVAASAATAAYQNHQRRNKQRLQPVHEYQPWEPDHSYFDQLRTPASANAIRDPPWRQYRQPVSSLAPCGPTPTDRLDSLLNGSQSRSESHNRPAGLTYSDARDSRGLVVVPNHDRRTETPYSIQQQRRVHRKPTLQQLQRSAAQQRQMVRPQSSQYTPYGPSPLVKRSHVPQDLIEGARALQVAGVVLPPQGPQGLMPQAPTRNHKTIASHPSTARSVIPQNNPSEVFELHEHSLSKSVDPIPRDLLESMGRLRCHTMIQLESGADSSLLPEMPDSIAADVAGSNYELLAVADDIAGDRIPYPRLALAGLSGSGKTHCLQLFLARVKTRAPSMNILEIDIPQSGAIQLKHQSEPRVHVCDRLDNVITMLNSLETSPRPWSLVVIEGLNSPRDAELVQSWCESFFTSGCCVVISTRRMDIARLFVDGHSPLLFTVTALSSWMATYLLSGAGTSSLDTDVLAKKLSYQASAIVGVSKLMSQTSMRTDQLSNYLNQLLSDPSRKDNPSFRLALEATGGFVSFEKGKNRPRLDKDAAALFTIMVHCVQRSWLNLFAEINETRPLAMVLLGVLAALGKSEIGSRLIGKIQQIVGSDDAVRCLQAHCLVTTEVLDGERVYRCPFPVLMAVQIWLAGEGELDSAFKLADAVARMEIS